MTAVISQQVSPNLAVLASSTIILNHHGEIISWNEAAEQCFGLEKQNAHGMSFSDFVDDTYHIRSKLNNTHAPQSFEFSIKTPDDKTHNCLFKLTPMKGQPYILVSFSYAGSMNSIDDYQGLSQKIQEHNALLKTTNTLLLNRLTNVEKLSKNLRDSQRHFKLLAENSTDLIARLKPNGVYLYVSPSCKQLLAYTPEQMVGRSSYDFYHEGDLVKIRKLQTENKKNNAPYTLTYRLRHKDGYFIWFETTYRLIRDTETNKILEIHAASRDITERIMEERANNQTQKLAKATRLTTMEEMASGMAHEINQPLAAVVNYTRGCVRYLEKHQKDYDKKLIEIMEKAVAQAERAGEITHRLKSFFSKGKLYKAPEKINRLIKEVVDSLRNDLNNSHTKVVYKFSRKLPIIMIDKIQIQQVVLNLLQNAIEAMQDSAISKKQITIKTAFNNKSVEVILSDTGPGFTPELINKIYQPFFTTKPYGTGMGLPISRSIVEAHRGNFLVRAPKYNKEGWVCFTLPVTTRGGENA